MKYTRKQFAVIWLLLATLNPSTASSILLPNPPKTAKNFVLQKKGDIIYLNLLNMDLNPITMIGKDGIGRIVFSETIKNANRVHRAFNFVKAFSGTYTLKVKDGSKTYIKTIKIEP